MNHQLPALTPKKVLKALLKQEAGFYIHHQTGSHVYLKHRNDPTVLVPIPMHVKDLKRGTMAGILRKAKLNREAFLKLLRGL